jgi:transposase-like protein
MTKREGKAEVIDRKGLLAQDTDFVRAAVEALVGALAEMYVQGVSTRKVKAVTEALCGHRFSASSISAVRNHSTRHSTNSPGGG